MEFKQFDVAKVVEISNSERLMTHSLSIGLRAPKIGDIGTIVEVYTLGYEVESCDEYGVTQWLATFEPGEITLDAR